MSSLARAITVRARWLLPALVVILALVPAWIALREQTFGIFGRDQGIFQYVAWALRNGDRAYRDIHEINGPFPHAWYVLMQLAGGEDEHVFRTIDTLVLSSAYVFGGITLPRWVGLDTRSSRPALLFWGLAGLAIYGTQYVRFDWWHTAQREGLYAALILVSVGCQSIAQTTQVRRTALIALAIAGLTTSLPWFGKPPCALFALLQAVVLYIDRKSLVVPLRAAAFSVLAGVLVVLVSMLAFVTAYEDLGRGIEMLSKVPRLHHTIWNESLTGIYRAFNNGPRLDWAFATFLGFLVAFFVFKMPRRALLCLVLPVGGFIVFAGQGKAFPYHLHMVTLGTTIEQLAIIAAFAHYLQTTDNKKSWPPLVAAALALALGAKSAQDALLSPSVRGEWAAAGPTAEARSSRAYFDHFGWGDFFANDLRDASAYLAFHTRPDERVQTYGFDPYLLFLARRKSASPVIYNFELNVDAALEGGPGARPDEELKTWLLAYRDDAEKLVLQAVEASPPAAFALVDRAPFTHKPDAEVDFAAHCPRLYEWMTARYERAASFGAVRIWLRRDVLARR